MTRSYAPGTLRLAILGDLLRHPMSYPEEMRERLDIANVDTVRVTLKRMAEKGWVSGSSEGWVLTTTGRAYVRDMRRMLSI